MLELRKVETSYSQSQVLFGLDLQINDGEVVTLLGRNGMGKTTTIHSIMGLARAQAGEIIFDGDQVRDWPPHRVAQAGIGLVPEGRQIFPNLTVLENLIATAANRSKNEKPWNLEREFDLFPMWFARGGRCGNKSKTRSRFHGFSFLERLAAVAIKFSRTVRFGKIWRPSGTNPIPA
jgi:branched-chain amino acid transport system ATP-binding protein